MKILGIDPGLIQTGFGLINIKNNNEIKLIDYGVIKPLLKDTLSKRLLTIFNDICEIIKIHKPKIFVIEDIFYGKNVKSAMRLGQARGAAMVAAAFNEVPIYEYSARKVKQSITGNGNAHIDQVRFMVKNLLKMDTVPKSNDASDALGIALCYLLQNKLENL